jgi:Plus-3 domain
MDLETSDEEAEIIKSEQEEKERKLLGITVHNDNDEHITISDINKVRLTRDTLAKYFLVPWFKDYVKGAASTVFFMPLFDDSLQERMYVILWEWTNIVSMRFVVRAPSTFNPHLYPLTLP